MIYYEYFFSQKYELMGVKVLKRNFTMILQNSRKLTCSNKVQKCPEGFYLFQFIKQLYSQT